MKVRKIFTFLFFLFYFLCSIELLNAQQTSLGLSNRPDFKKDYTWLNTSLNQGWSNSVGLQFQHDLANKKWGFRLGLFYLNRLSDAYFVGGFIDPLTLTSIDGGALRKKSISMSIPLELVFKAKPKLEIGLGLTYHHFIFSSLRIDGESFSDPINFEAPIQVGVINSINWLMIDEKWLANRIKNFHCWFSTQQLFQISLILISYEKFKFFYSHFCNFLFCFFSGCNESSTDLYRPEL